MSGRGGTEFGRALRQHRLAAGLSQEALAELTGLSVRGISDLERGTRRTPRPETVRLISIALGLDDATRAELISMSRRALGSETIERDGAATRAVEGREFHVNPIPRPSTQLIGRSQAVSELIDVLRDPSHGLVTLTGPGGAGKSHLSSQVGRDAAAYFPDGVSCVFFGSTVARDSPILPVIADSMGIREVDGSPILETIAASLGDARLLLLLDCLENVIGDAQSVIDLLERCPGLKVLATSRVPLHVRGEYVYRVEPLSIPDGASALTADDVSRYSALELFVTRMRMASSAPVLSDSTIATIAEICRKLDGLPLAIVLAAARTRVLSLSELHAQLNDQLSVLSAGPIDLPVRQQTLRNIVRWSYDLLSADEQALFRLLAVFAGGWTMDAVATVASGTSGPERRAAVIDQLTSLIDQNLVVRRSVTELESRYNMLDTIRAFAIAMLDEHGERDDAGLRHYDYYLALAGTHAGDVTGQRHAFHPDRVEADRDNLRAAIRWAIDINDASRALVLVAALREFWGVKGHFSEGRRWLDAALALDGDAPAAIRARALDAAGWLACHQGDLHNAEQYAQESLRLNRQDGTQDGLADSLHGAGLVAQLQGDFARAQCLYHECVTLKRAMNHPELTRTLGNLAQVMFHLGDTDGAVRTLEDCVGIDTANSDTVHLGVHQTDLALILLVIGDDDRAGELFLSALQSLREVGHARMIACALEGLATLTARSGIAVRALTLFGAAEALREAIDYPLQNPEQWQYYASVELARSLVDHAIFETVWATGRDMSMPAAVTFALEHQPEPPD